MNHQPKRSVLGAAPEGSRRSTVGGMRRARNVYLDCAALRPAEPLVVIRNHHCGGAERRRASRCSEGGRRRVLDRRCAPGMAFALRRQAGRVPAGLWRRLFPRDAIDGPARNRPRLRCAGWRRMHSACLFPMRVLTWVIHRLRLLDLADDAGLAEILRVLRPQGQRHSGFRRTRRPGRQVVPNLFQARAAGGGHFRLRRKRPVCSTCPPRWTLPPAVEMLDRMRTAGFGEASWDRAHVRHRPDCIEEGNREVRAGPYPVFRLRGGLLA